MSACAGKTVAPQCLWRKCLSPLLGGVNQAGMAHSCHNPCRPAFASFAWSPIYEGLLRMRRAMSGNEAHVPTSPAGHDHDVALSAHADPTPRGEHGTSVRAACLVR